MKGHKNPWKIYFVELLSTCDSVTLGPLFGMYMFVVYSHFTTSKAFL